MDFEGGLTVVFFFFKAHCSLTGAIAPACLWLGPPLNLMKLKINLLGKIVMISPSNLLYYSFFHEHHFIGPELGYPTLAGGWESKDLNET